MMANTNSCVVLWVEMSDFLVMNLTQCWAILVVKPTGTYRKIFMAVKNIISRLWVRKRTNGSCRGNDEYI